MRSIEMFYLGFRAEGEKNLSEHFKATRSASDIKNFIRGVNQKIVMEMKDYVTRQNVQLFSDSTFSGGCFESKCPGALGSKNAHRKEASDYSDD